MNTASGYICPKCRDVIMHDRLLDQYYCWRRECDFRETREEYKHTLRDIELTRQRQNAIDYTKLRADNLDGKSRVAARRDAFGPVVYYIQFRDAIKIGTAIDPANRLSALPWEWVLAMEPGGRELEQGRHQQFEKTRFLGEWFYDSAELREHIDYINDMHSKWRDQRFPQCPDFPWRHDEVVIPPIVAELSG